MKQKKERTFNVRNAFFFTNLLIFSLLICSSCSNESLDLNEDLQEVSTIPEKFSKLLTDLSLDANEVRYIESLDAIAHGDILYSADTNSDENIEKAHWHNRRVSRANSRNINYTVRGVNSANYIAAIDQAAQAWENMSPNINFTRVSNNANGIDLTISFLNAADYARVDNSGSGAFATFPTGNGNIGNRISFNESSFRNTFNSWKILLTIHEIGHTLGFRHPNQGGGVAIPCAGSQQWHQNNPAGSVMNSALPWGNWPSQNISVAQWASRNKGWTLTDRYIIDWAYELAGNNDPVCN
ncbi:M57 family metalloprotease [Aquimarina sp. 2201CG1-2-11]|uniref:M57 family metalloprotease n=1 Tax=Aquimarina discodermiae TaxID=3231043 RepID=UPI0034637CF2